MLFFSRFISQRGTELKRLRGVPQGNDQNASPPGLVPKTSLTTNGCSWVPLVPSWCQRQIWHTVGSLGYILTARRSVFTFWLLPLRPLSLRLQQSDNNENNITWGWSAPQKSNLTGQLDPESEWGPKCNYQFPET